jgi:hypothetical protein
MFRLVFNAAKASLDQGNFFIAPGADMGAMMAGNLQATPSKLLQFKPLSDARINAFEQKAGFAIADNYYELDKYVTGEAGVRPDAIIDLTSRMSPDGTLTWAAPAGQWKVVRVGYSLTGTMNHPATREATGLEVDKYDRSAVTTYMLTYLDMYRQATNGLLGERGVRALVTDSTEVGPSNWTPHLFEAFRRLRGYDARAWLPALTGVIVGSRRESDAFLYDFRRTLGELTATEHYATVADIAHQYGLTLYGESLEGTRAVLGDDMDMRRFADVPMAALWTYRKAPSPNYVADVRGAASVAHIYGRKYVAAESLTSILAPWAFAPSDLQPMIDAEFLNGVNRPVIHTSVHQPTDDKLPGLSLSVFGQNFNRHETWSEMAKPWIDYLARNSFMLQQGTNVADVAYLYGEEVPLGAQAREKYFPDVPKRYGYDFLSPDALLTQLANQGTDVVTRGGARYKAIYLGGQSQVMTLAELRRLNELVEGGATIIGNPPQRSPSLKDDPKEFAALTSRLWANAGTTQVGAGRVIKSSDIESTLRALNLAADFDYQSTQADSEIAFAHRHIDDGEIYLVSNRTKRPELFDGKFRVVGKIPEIWHADSGLVEAVSYRTDAQGTVVPLQMLPNESFFVVFRKATTEPTDTVVSPTYTSVGEIAGPWMVAFQVNRGAPASTRLEALQSFSENADQRIKYFSGISTYTNTFHLPNGVKPGSPLLIDLGHVGDVAEVRINGKLAGTVWKAPYRVDIGPLVHKGSNELDIRVANLWVNRLVGDAQPGAAKITFTTYSTYIAKAPLRPSGLLGPVSLVTPGW